MLAEKEINHDKYFELPGYLLTIIPLQSNVCTLSVDMNDLNFALGGETFTRCPKGGTTRHNGGRAVPAGNSCPRPLTRSDFESSFFYLNKLKLFVRHV